MHSGRVLVVAPDHDLRRALTFALSAYGYTVTSESAWSRLSDTDGYDCIVLDAHALSRPDVAPPAMLSDLGPIVLLAYSEGALSNRWVDAIVAMPLRGEAVIQAVSALIAASSQSTK